MIREVTMYQAVCDGYDKISEQFGYNEEDAADKASFYEFREYDNKQTKDDLCWNTEDGFQYEYLAPTQALAARWLREGHHIFIMLTPVIQGWMYDLFDLKKHQYILCNEDAMTESYEAAFETALRESIKLLKK